MDDRLRQFSPPPWAALGRRDPNHEQAPWRESENLEWKVNPSWREWGRALVQDDLPYLPERIIGNLSAMGQRPASDALMQRYMDEASELLPRSNVDIEAPYRIPYYAAARAEGGRVPWQKAAASAGQRMALYEAELRSLQRAGVPYSEWPSYQQFLRGFD